MASNIFEIADPNKRGKPKAPPDWSPSVLFKDKKHEPLRFPNEALRNNLVAAGYKTLAQNLSRFKELDSLSFKVDFAALNDRWGLAESFQKNNAIWHRSCFMKCNNTELKRAEKR